MDALQPSPERAGLALEGALRRLCSGWRRWQRPVREVRLGRMRYCVVKGRLYRTQPGRCCWHNQWVPIAPNLFDLDSPGGHGNIPQGSALLCSIGFRAVGRVRTSPPLLKINQHFP